MMDITFVGTETGGLNPKTDALLTVGLVRVVESEIVDAVEFTIQSEGLNVTSEARAVNGIDVTWHDKLSPPRAVVADLIKRWLGKHSDRHSYRSAPGGHNVWFDLQFLRQLDESIVEMFTYRVVDTASILRFLQDAGLYPEASCSLETAVRHYLGLTVRHSAMSDAALSAKLYLHLVRYLMYDLNRVRR